MRETTGIIAKVARILAIAMAVYHLGAVLVGTPEALRHRSAHLFFALTLTFLTYPARQKDTKRFPVYDAVLALLTLISVGYIYVNYEYIITRMYYADPPKLGDLVCGLTFVILVLEASRRAIGTVLPLVATVFLSYLFLGPYLPGVFRHPGFDLGMLVDQMYLTTEGIFSIPAGVSATYVIMFVLFGAFLEKSGAGTFFTDFATALTGGARGGPGKIAVLSSGFFGTISGSAVANVMVTGLVTIPMMIRTGFKRAFAAAVEAVASTGGQIMPPIMGAAAFVMAEFMAIPYIQVAKHAAIPAMLYFLAAYVAVHFRAEKAGLKGVPKEELPSLREVAVKKGYLFIPVIIILGLLIKGYTPTYAAMAACGSVVALSWVRKETRMYFKDILDALEQGAVNCLSVATACACAGIVVGVISLTGLGLRFTSLVLAVAGQRLVLALALTMVACIILGMGIPTTPAYIIAASLLIPALIKLGLVPIAAHMFVFYFAIISAITPPVALAVYAAAGLADAKMWEAGMEAVKLGAVGFIVPFMFASAPSLLLVGAPSKVVLAVITATIGVIALAASLQGMLLAPANALERAILLAAALLLIRPGASTDIVGLAALAAALVVQYLRRRKMREEQGSVA